MISPGAWRRQIHSVVSGVEHARLAVRRVAVVLALVAVAVGVQLEEQQHKPQYHQSQGPVTEANNGATPHSEEGGTDGRHNLRGERGIALGGGARVDEPPAAEVWVCTGYCQGGRVRVM